MAMSEWGLNIQAFPPGAAGPTGEGAGTPSLQPGAKVPSEIPLNGIRLVDVVETPRMLELDRLERYAYGLQDAHKMYDWDGRIPGYGGEAPIEPGYSVPYAHRKPKARYDLGTFIVSRFTSFLFGPDLFPEIKIEGDEEAEDYVKELAKESNLPARMIRARNIGGAVGSVGLSFRFKDGKPRVEAHNAKHLTVLRWEDEEERIVGAVLKAYKYPRRIFDPETRKLRDFWFYYARYWDTVREIVWEPIPVSLGDTFGWVKAPSFSYEHNFGFCPFYWIQNTEDSENADGVGDYDSLTDNFDTVNQLVSAASKGVLANCDPTLLVKEDPALNTGSIRKGSNDAIWSKGGAEYLTLPGDATKAALDMAELLRKYTLDVANVVQADPDTITGSAQSAAALRLLYAPMLAQCSIYREQYGTYGIIRILKGMLRAAKMYADQIVLTDRVVIDKMSEEVGQEVPTTPATPRLVKRTPGTSENIELNWNPYFPPTWADISTASDAVIKANGGKQVISQKTAVQAVQTLFGVTDVDEELRRIKLESEEALETNRRTLEMQQDIESKGLSRYEDERGIAAREEDETE